jgi:hypothetical protein
LESKNKNKNNKETGLLAFGEIYKVPTKYDV